MLAMDHKGDLAITLFEYFLANGAYENEEAVVLMCSLPVI
jgi:hypothetical protein